MVMVSLQGNRNSKTTCVKSVLYTDASLSHITRKLCLPLLSRGNFLGHFLSPSGSLIEWGLPEGTLQIRPLLAGY